MKVKYFDLKNKRVLITGGAGVIGSQIAKDFKKQGAEVILLDISEEGLLKTQKESFPNQFDHHIFRLQKTIF